MFAVLRLLKSLELENGHKVSCCGSQGMEGMIPVFDTIEAAEKIYGKGIDVVAIDTGEKE